MSENRRAQSPEPVPRKLGVTALSAHNLSTQEVEASRSEIQGRILGSMGGIKASLGNMRCCLKKIIFSILPLILLVALILMGSHLCHIIPQPVLSITHHKISCFFSIFLSTHKCNQAPSLKMTNRLNNTSWLSCLLFPSVCHSHALPAGWLCLPPLSVNTC